MAAFLGVVLLGVLPGIVIAIVLSVANVFRRIWWPYRTTLGRVDGIAGLHDVAGHPGAALLDGCVVLRFDAPLIFANAGTFRDEVLALAARDPKPAWIVVAAEPITDVDTTACDMLEELVEKLDQRGVHLVFAELKDPARRKIDRYGLEHVMGEDRYYPTIRTATDAYIAATGANWIRPSG
jgi:MFS superfamily sulfate permease-like transporter